MKHLSALDFVSDFFRSFELERKLGDLPRGFETGLDSTGFDEVLGDGFGLGAACPTVESTCEPCT